MDIKLRAYTLYREGKSYREVADLLGVSKSTAHAYVKDYEIQRKLESYSSGIVSNVPNGSKPSRTAETQRSRRNVQNVSNVRDDVDVPNGDRRVSSDETTRNTPFTGVEPMDVVNVSVPNVRNEPERSGQNEPHYREFLSIEPTQEEHERFAFDGAFGHLIGQPTRPFFGVVWGTASRGKADFVLRFAHYLQTNFGKVIYFYAEQKDIPSGERSIRKGRSPLSRVGVSSKKLLFACLMDTEKDFVIIDHTNDLEIDDVDIRFYQETYPEKSFIVVTDAEDDEEHQRENALLRDCDFSIQIEYRMVRCVRRFTVSAQMGLFKEADNDKEIPENRTAGIQGVHVKEKVNLTELEALALDVEKGLREMEETEALENKNSIEQKSKRRKKRKKKWRR